MKWNPGSPLRWLAGIDRFYGKKSNEKWSIIAVKYTESSKGERVNVGERCQTLSTCNVKICKIAPKKAIFTLIFIKNLINNTLFKGERVNVSEHIVSKRHFLQCYFSKGERWVNVEKPTFTDVHFLRLIMINFRDLPHFGRGGRAFLPILPKGDLVFLTNFYITLLKPLDMFTNVHSFTGGAND